MLPQNPLTQCFSHLQYYQNGGGCEAWTYPFSQAVQVAAVVAPSALLSVFAGQSTHPAELPATRYVPRAQSTQSSSSAAPAAPARPAGQGVHASAPAASA